MRFRFDDKRVIVASGIAVGLGLVLIAVGVGAAFLGRGSTSGEVAPAALAATGAPGAAATSSATPTAPAETSANIAATSPGTVGAATVASASASAVTSVGPALDAYKGLGTWVDIYDEEAWRDPAAAVADMASHGVRTLYIETANYNSPTPMRNPAALSKFITESHAHNMRIVAWYLPNMKSNSVDFARIRKAIEFTSPDGQKFDSFALDIESTAITSDNARNRGLKSLSQRIRTLVGPKYPLGGIIPSPVGISQKKGYWNDFPYESVASLYDVILPMSYYTYHGNNARAAYADTMDNIRILRAQPGCSTIPIHMIGGIAEESSVGQVQAFSSAIKETQVFGASLYGWPGTNAAKWKAMSAVGQ